MITSKQPEETPESRGPGKWDYNPVPGGSQWRGWIAGKPFGAYVHFKKGEGSKPCLRKVTDEALPCEKCTEFGLVPDWRGYVPYYDEQYTPMFCLITREYLESVLEIKHLEPIVIRRGKKNTDPVIVEEKPWRTTPIPYKKERELEVSLAHFLVFKLWQNVELVRWCKLAKEPEVTTPKPTVEDYFDKGLENIKRLMAKEEEAKRENELAGNLAMDVIRQATTPKSNGKPFKRT